MGLSRGGVVIAACRSADYVAREVARQYKAQEAMDARSGAPVYLDNIDLQFSDGETCVRLDRSVKGCDAFLIQALLDPTSERCVDENYMAFLVAARALREWGAEHVTAVLPYLAYARQDKPSRGQREPTTAKLTADLAIEAGIDRLVTWHPHSPRVSGFYDRVSVDILDPLPLFVAEFNRFWSRDDVIVVAPDAGAYELVKRFSQALNLKSAVASKRRPRPEEAVVTDAVGDFTAKRIAIVLDDMISSGGTMYAVIEKLARETEIEEVHIGVSHCLCMEIARERLLILHDQLGLEGIMVTDSIPQSDAFRALPFLTTRSLSGVFALAISGIHHHQSVTEPSFPTHAEK